MSKILTLFKDNTVSFLDELIEQFPSESELYLARHLVKDQMDTELVISGFIQEVLPYKKAVQERDDDVFVNGKVSIIRGAPANRFKVLWKSLDEDNKNTIWQWFDLFIELAEKYQLHK